jgi:hypothetical protein
MTEAGPTNPHKPLDVDAVALGTLERRKRIEREDRAFVAQLRAAILCGFETPAGVLGHQHGPRRRHSC